jgi:hypothetical protein
LSLFFRELFPYENNLEYELGIRLIHEKKSEVKNIMLLSLYGKFLVSRKTDSFKNIFGDFLNHPELRKRD